MVFVDGTMAAEQSKMKASVLSCTGFTCIFGPSLSCSLLS